MSRLPVTFGQPALVVVADRHARAFMSWFWHRRRRWLTAQQHLLLVTVVGVVAFALLQPLGLIVLALMLLQLAWVTLRRTRLLALSKADEPGAEVPTQVTIDAEGAHVVGPGHATHHRWDELGGASIRKGFLVLEDRARSVAEIICLDHLGPAVDGRTLLAEVTARLQAQERHPRSV